MRRATGVLLALALLSPFAAAGSEADPEIVDARDQTDASTDLLAAWFEYDPGGVRFTLKVAGADRDIRDRTYWVSFRAVGKSTFALVGFDGNGVIGGYLGPPNGGGWERGGFENVVNHKVTNVRFQPGAPAYVTGVIPWGALPGFEEGVTLIDLSAGMAAYDRANRVWRGGLDQTMSTATFQAVPVADLSTSPLLWGLVGAVSLGGGAAVAVVLARSRANRKAAEAALDPAAPVPEPRPSQGRDGQGRDDRPAQPPEPGARFRIDPRR